MNLRKREEADKRDEGLGITKNTRRYETPEFHTSQNLAEERFVMVNLQGSDRMENAFSGMNET